MRLKILLICAALIFSGGFTKDALAGIVNITLQPDDGKDAWIQNSRDGEDTNYSDATKLTTNTPVHANAGLLEFDLADYQGSKVKKAILITKFR